jgi:hypothetical protein
MRAGLERRGARARAGASDWVEGPAGERAGHERQRARAGGGESRRMVGAGGRGCEGTLRMRRVYGVGLPPSESP